MLTRFATCVLAPPTDPPSQRNHTATAAHTAPISILKHPLPRPRNRKDHSLSATSFTGRSTPPAPKPSHPHPRDQPHRTCKEMRCLAPISTDPRATGYVPCPSPELFTQQMATCGFAAPIAQQVRSREKKMDVRLCRVPPEAAEVRKGIPGRIGWVGLDGCVVSRYGGPMSGPCVLLR
jgi:hypothetical protein